MEVIVFQITQNYALSKELVDNKKIVDGDNACMSKLVVQELTKRRDGRLIVDNVSFQIEGDELFVLLGPPESGKRAILRLICGLEEMDRGRVWLNDQDITRMSPGQRNIATVFHDDGIFPNMTIFDNVAYALRVRRLPRKEVHARIARAAELLDLEEILKSFPASLSAGELQRVALACALVKDTDVYLFDELVSQLQTLLRLRTSQEIMLIQGLKQKPAIYVTSDQSEALAMGDRVAVIVSGRIQQVGTPDELLKRPANLFVAQFVGRPSINIIEGSIQHTGTRYRLRADGMFFTLPARWTRILAQLGPQGTLLLGIRPNTIIPEWDFASLETIPHLVVRAQITHLDSSSGKTIARLRVGLGTDILAEFANRQFLWEGQLLNIALSIDTLYFFHPQTGGLLNRDKD
jgi:multiple sugar transport system ATP-binding protein